MRDLIPCCYYPTNIVMIDDDVDYVDVLSGQLKQATQEGRLKAKLGRAFTNPSETLHYLNEEVEPRPFIHRCMQLPGSADLSHHAINVNLSEIYREVFNTKRFDEISTLIVDYSMAGMDGLELCSHLQDDNIQKILLTGAADEALAVRAFNDGIINSYLCKQAPKAFESLLNLIHEAQWRYFSRLTRLLIGTMMKRPKFPIAWQDPTFVQFFKNLLKERDCCEFYLFETVGSYFILDSNAKVSALFTQNLDQQTAYFWEVQDAPEFFGPNLIEEVKNHNKIFCFSVDKEKSEENINKWKSFLRPATEIRGLNTFHYAIVDNFSGLKEKVTNFKQYLKHP